MTTIPLSRNGKTPFQKIIGYNPEILEKWNSLEASLFSGAKLSSNLLEEVRRTLAFGNKCKYCMAKGHPRMDHTNKKEELATSFADLFARDIDSVSRAHFQILQEEFSNEEISFLCAFISFVSASQKLGRIFQIK